MRVFALFILMIATRSAVADCLDTWFSYTSSKLNLSADFSEGCYAGKLILKYAENSKNEKQWPNQKTKWKEVPFRTECSSIRKSKDNEIIEFSCNKNGVTPLAGASYRYKKVKEKYKCEDGSDPLPRRYFYCTHGCQTNTPKELDLDYSEGPC